MQNNLLQLSQLGIQFPFQNQRIQLETGGKLNVYRVRNDFFRNLFIQNNMFQTFIGQDEIFDNPNFNYTKAQYILQNNNNIPSLLQFKYYLLPSLFFGELRFDNSIIPANQSNNLVQNGLLQLSIDTPNQPQQQLNLNSINPLNPQEIYHLGQELPQYSQHNIMGIINAIQQGFWQNEYEQVLFNVEVLYSDLDFIPWQEINDNEEDIQLQRINLIKYMRAWSVIDRQILQYNNEQFVEQQQLNYDNNQDGTFKLTMEDPQHNDPNVGIQWRKRNFNFRFVKENTYEQFHNIYHTEYTFYMSAINNINDQGQDNNYILNQIFNKIQVLEQHYEEATFPTFIRSVDIYAIKEFSDANNDFPQINQLAQNNPQQPYNINNNIDDLFENLLNGLVAFDYNYYSPPNQININDYDILPNNEIYGNNQKYHCLLRIIFFFEKILEQDDQLIKYNNIDEFIDQFNDDWMKKIDINIEQMQQGEKIFLGCIKDLCIYIKDKFDIIFGIYLIKNSQCLFASNQFQLLIHNNHCVLTSLDKCQQIKSIQQKKYPYQIKSKDYIPKNKTIKNMIIPTSRNYYLDTETFIFNDLNGEQQCYLICIIDEYNNKTSFQGIDCIQQFLNYIDYLLIQFPNPQDNEQFEICNIWSFNGGKFDYMFFIPDIIKKFKKQYIIGSDTDCKQIQIEQTIYFKDIKYIFTQGSLNDQAKLWKIEQQKQEFDIKGWTLQMYQDPIKFNKVLEYCYQDCLVLKGIVDKFYELVNYEFQNNKHNTLQIQFDIRKCFSIASLTMTIFRQFYLKHQLLASQNREIYNIERGSYYGGITQNYIKEGKDLYYYDINSSYPNVMNNCIIPIRPNCYFKQKQLIEDQINPPNQLQLQNYYLYEVEVQYHDNIIITTLPTRTQDGLIYLKTIDKSWRWGCELKFINKFKLGIIKYYHVIKYKGEKIFQEFITDLYNKRLTEKRDDLKQLYKDLMNNVYGKLGQKEFPITEYVNVLNVEEYLKNPLLENIKNMGKDTYKISMGQKDNISFTGAMVRIASYITAQSRCNLMEGIYKCGPQNIYYCDTDSIISKVQLPSSMVGNKLGQWKLENEIKFGQFLAPKVYYLQLKFADKKGKFEQFKCKGIRNNVLNGDCFKKLSEQNYLILQNKGVFTRKFGSVFINDQNKCMRIKDLKRIWNDNDSRPYNNINDYILDKQIKEESNIEILMKQQLIKKGFNGQNLDDKLDSNLIKRFNKIIHNNDQPINIKRKQYFNDKYNDDQQQYLNDKKIKQ